jgi:hypothetical protein
MIDNGFHGYGFHTDDQVLLQPGKAAKRKRDESRRKESVGAELAAGLLKTFQHIGFATPRQANVIGGKLADAVLQIKTLEDVIQAR